MQGIIVFASVMATLGLQILLESGRQFVSKVCNFNTIFFDLRVYMVVSTVGLVHMLTKVGFEKGL